MNSIREWFRKQLSNPEVVILSVLLLVGVVAIIFVAHMLAPVIAAIILAYILQGAVDRMTGLGLPRIWSVVLVFSLFLALLLFAVFGLLPLLLRQITQFLQQAPSMINEAQLVLLSLPQHYPQLVTEEQVQILMSTIRGELLTMSQLLLSYSVSSIVTLIYLVVYLILVPFLVFFFLKDRDRILVWCASFLPKKRHLATQVWHDANAQFASYIRGKVWEILIVGIVTYMVFSFLGLQYAALLAALTGLSVLIPYIGAAVVTLPVAVVAFFQWGWSVDFAYVLIAYGIIQALDGNVLAPLLFSEVVNLHPVAIIVAILVFGGLWGFWGVFFAIPLATLVQSVLKAWPRDLESLNEVTPETQAAD